MKPPEITLRPETRADFPGLANLKRRVMYWRRWPSRTTPVSRHVHQVALALVNGERYAMLGEDPIHCGVSMLYVLERLWKIEVELARLKGEKA